LLRGMGASGMLIAACGQELQAPKHTPFGSACECAVFDSLVLPACNSYHHKMFRIRRLSTQTLDIGPSFSIACFGRSNRASQEYSLETLGHLATSGLTAPPHVSA